jgi:hypothetical protein
LRAALEALPADAMRRCRAIIAQIGDGMVRGAGDRRCYADEVLGEAVIYAARVVAPAHEPPLTACKAAGRALQLANDVRDAASDRARDLLLYQALAELPIVPRLLRWLPRSVGPGTRAAATLVVVTTCAFYLRQVMAQVTTQVTATTVEVPRALRRPLRAALAAACSPRAYLATVAAIEDVLRDALGALGAPLGAHALRPALPAETPDSVDSAATLIALAMELIHAVPERKLDAAIDARCDRRDAAAADARRDGAPDQPGRAIVLADYLLFQAVERLTSLGPGSTAQVAALLAQLAVPADRAALARSTALAAFAEEVAR